MDDRRYRDLIRFRNFRLLGLTVQRYDGFWKIRISYHAASLTFVLHLLGTQHESIVVIYFVLHMRLILVYLFRKIFVFAFLRRIRGTFLLFLVMTIAYLIFYRLVIRRDVVVRVRRLVSRIEFYLLLIGL